MRARLRRLARLALVSSAALVVAVLVIGCDLAADPEVRL